jgi:hypothetical protein
METNSHVLTGLYPRLLGDSWHHLDEMVQRLHVQGRPVRAVGSFRIRHGNSRLARWIVRLFGMPPAGEAVPTELVVTPYGHGEQWVRTFAEQPLATTQWGSDHGILVEHLGILEFRFRLEVADGVLVYHHMGVTLCLGPLSIPLPHWAMPQVVAREEPGGGSKRTHVSVQIFMPSAGRLISYEGTVASEEVP